MGSKTSTAQNIPNQSIENHKHFKINHHSYSEDRAIPTQQSARSGAVLPFQALSALKELAPSVN
ncbi:hypothetical protein [Pantoea agglomerans]|uniref:hypothetical protein n=1 Tax=Enterobacter agglomerans TaxID=549 RepID=UPI002448D583|nr:hypothetical protein [Pantoea agglomerans]MDH1171935.1 hypothetical protein [Pantoea agglomerans]